jgi:hypothetical protein
VSQSVLRSWSRIIFLEPQHVVALYELEPTEPHTNNAAPNKLICVTYLIELDAQYFNPMTAANSQRQDT